MSQRPGITVMPSVEMISAPSGTASVPTWPTAEVFSPSMRMTLFWIGGPAKPSTSVPPTMALRRDGAGWAPWPRCPWAVTPGPRTSAAIRPQRSRRMFPPDVKADATVPPAVKSGGAGGSQKTPGPEAERDADQAEAGSLEDKSRVRSHARPLGDGAKQVRQGDQREQRTGGQQVRLHVRFLDDGGAYHRCFAGALDRVARPRCSRAG